jgi:hypothetical protein
VQTKIMSTLGATVRQGLPADQELRTDMRAIVYVTSYHASKKPILTL